jgi:hypothetical protein
MPGFKQSLTWTDGGITAGRQPIVLSLDLTPEQKSLITRFTGKTVSKLEMTASDLQMVHVSVLKPLGSAVIAFKY